jgi:flagellar biogenesis protein FliO
MNCLIELFKSSFCMVTGLTLVTTFPALANGLSIDSTQEAALSKGKPQTPLITTQPAVSNSSPVPPIPASDASPAQASGALVRPTNTTAQATSAVSEPSVLKSGDTIVGNPSAAGAQLGTTAAVSGAQVVKPEEAANQPATLNSGSSPAVGVSTTSENTLLVPNGAALQPQLLPLGQSEQSPWTAYATGGFLILGLAAAGVMMVRLRQGKAFGLNKAEKQMQLVSTLALSPKRQIILVRIRDKEVALASTEQGITLLTEMQSPNKHSSAMLDDGGSEEPRRRKVQQRIVQEEPAKMIASGASESVGQETAIARSEMLMGALKNLREKNLRGKGSSGSSENSSSASMRSSDSEASEKKILETVSESRSKGEPTLKQTRAAFPKYLANAFEQESKRNIGTNTNSSGSDEAGNVTNMIRERLKDLRPLA